MSERLIHTSIGVIDIDKEIEGFIIQEEPCVVIGKELIIKTCKTKVIIKLDNGEEKVMEPLVTESCMNPDIVTIQPLTIKAVYNDNRTWHRVYISNQYENIEIDIENDPACARTEQFLPCIKKSSCAECNNCGRC